MSRKINGIFYTEEITWNNINWSNVKSEVKQLRYRIFTVSKNNGTQGLRNLQRLMLKSDANLLESIRRVTQKNDGKNTAGDELMAKFI